MKILILSSSIKGSASAILPALLNQEEIEVVGVIFSHGKVVNKRRHCFLKLKKIIKIGLLGTLKGIQMRKWYVTAFDLQDTQNLNSICQKHDVSFFETPSINCDQTRSLFKALNADLGISLGNGYIAPSVFKIPSLGMVNVHHEQLPDYQNAQSVIWQIYNMSSQTGFTIHKIEKHIDTGAILLQENIDIEFHQSLGDTVSYTYAKLIKQSAEGLVKLLKEFNEISQNERLQGEGTSYTTPSIWQYYKMKKQHKILRKQ